MPDKAKRTVYTPEQRVAKLEAELAKAKQRAEAKANKEVNALFDKRNKLVKRHSDLLSKIDEIDTQLARLGVEQPVTISTDTDMDRFV